MADSENKNAEQPGLTAPVESVEIVKHHRNAEHLVKIVRGEKGKFVKQKKTMPKSEDMTRLLRNLLMQAEAGPDGKMRKGDITRARKIIDNIIKIASNDPNSVVLDKLGQPFFVVDKDGNKHPITIFDAKAAMASTQAFKELWLRSYGMPSKSDEELEAQKAHGVKIVILQHPEMMNKEVVEDKPKEQLKPAFIDAEFTENK